MEMDLLDYLQHCQEDRPLRRPEGDMSFADEHADKRKEKQPPVEEARGVDPNTPEIGAYILSSDSTGRR